MRKLAALAAVVTMSVGALTACSGGDYCGDLKGYVDSAKDLDIKDSDAVGKKAQAAKGDTNKLMELAKSDGSKIEPAMKAIQQQAKDTCKIEINS
jgi:hypothetical protein